MALERKIEDIAGDQINPATEDKQDDVLAELQNIRVLDADNSFEENLGNGGVFTGEWVEVLDKASVSVEVASDQDSAVNGYQVQSSNNASDVQHTHSHSLTAGVNHHFVYTLTNRYYRIVYTNGTTPTTAFCINSFLSKVDLSHQHTHGVEFVVDGDHPADLVRSVLTAKRADNAYSNIRSTNGDNLKISLEELEDAVSVNGNKQLKVTQFDSSGLEIKRLSGNVKSFEDTSFVTGDSPVVLDCNTALGRNAIKGFILNDGPGDFTVAFSDDGVSYGDEITRKPGEFLNFDDDSVDSIRITWIADSAYRVGVK